MTYLEMLDVQIAHERVQTEYCMAVHQKVKELIKEDLMIVFDKPIKTYGKYVELESLAMCQGVLMCSSQIGWCDKPVQPYHSMFWHFIYIAKAIEQGKYHLEPNVIKNNSITICI